MPLRGWDVFLRPRRVALSEPPRSIESSNLLREESMRSAVIAVALSTPVWTCSLASAQQILNVPTSQRKIDTALLLRDSPAMPDLPTTDGVRTLNIPAGEDLRV